MTDTKEIVVPKVDMGATIYLHSDSHAATIVAVYNRGRSVCVKRDIARPTKMNAFTEDQGYEYEPDPNGAMYEFTLRQNGRWVLKGDPMRAGWTLGIDHRRTYIDPTY